MRSIETLGSMLVRVVFGPRIEGEVVDTAEDSQDPEVQHLLVETLDGEIKHIMQPNVSVGVNITRGEVGIYDNTHKMGDKLSMNIRGKGIMLPPWSRIDRDPFGLRVKKERQR